ncbi:MAG: hypothetical protein Q8N99_07000 [Nanoarchaeota archaeon]|nr:hypothetical protein [Nanoarchaeota archaeon]
MAEKKSVKEFQNEIRAEEVKMQKYGKKFDDTVKSLKSDCRAKEGEMQEYAKKQATAVKHLCGEIKTLKNSWDGYGKDLKEAATEMRNQGINKMKGKVREFNKEILNQKKENQVSISRMKGDVGLFVSEIEGKRKDFESYAKGPFAGYIKAFWG